MKRIYLTFVFAGAVCFQVAAQNVDEDRILSADSLITMDGRLDSLYRSLPEVMVVGERPVVKAMQGKLVYDLPRLIQNFAVDNAYDAIKELPGVSEMNDNLTLGRKKCHGCIGWQSNHNDSGTTEHSFKKHSCRAY